MKKEELVKSLMELNIPEHMYSLEGGLPNEAYCVALNDSHWEVYYSERGKKVNLNIFNSSEDAYKHLYFTLKSEVGKGYF